jgi:putative ABC transport system permease protein
LLLADNGTVVTLGLIIGMLAATGTARLLGSMLYGISATHAGTYGAVLAVVGIVAALACIVPARRALGINPVIALQHD